MIPNRRRSVVCDAANHPRWRMNGPKGMLVNPTCTIDELPVPASTDAPEFAEMAEIRHQSRPWRPGGSTTSWMGCIGAVSRAGSSILGEDGTAWEALQCSR